MHKNTNNDVSCSVNSVSAVNSNGLMIFCFFGFLDNAFDHFEDFGHVLFRRNRLSCNVELVMLTCGWPQSWVVVLGSIGQIKDGVKRNSLVFIMLVDVHWLKVILSLDGVVIPVVQLALECHI